MTAALRRSRPWFSPSRARVWSICLRITGDHGDAEDALQEALSAAGQHIGLCRDDAR